MTEWRLVALLLALFIALSPAACVSANTPTPVASSEPAPTSPQEAKAMCWMSYEGKSAPRDLDKRVALVDKCIEEKMKRLPTAQ